MFKIGNCLWEDAFRSFNECAVSKVLLTLLKVGKQLNYVNAVVMGSKKRTSENEVCHRLLYLVRRQTDFAGSSSQMALSLISVQWRLRSTSCVFLQYAALRSKESR